VWEGPLASAGELAARFRLWLVADLGPQRDDEERVFPSLHVFSDDGALVGSQRQIHLSRDDRAMMVSPGEELRIFDYPAGALGLLVGADALVPEVSRALTLLGAEILIHVGLLRVPSEGAWRTRLWREVQANQTFGIEAYPVGQGLAGRSGILAPVEMTPDGGGILARASDANAEAVVVAELDFGARAALIQKYDILAEMNLPLYRRQLLSLYRKESQR
jgi:predicted amidohydrolase